MRPLTPMHPMYPMDPSPPSIPASSFAPYLTRLDSSTSPWLRSLASHYSTEDVTFTDSTGSTIRHRPTSYRGAHPGEPHHRGRSKQGNGLHHARRPNSVLEGQAANDPPTSSDASLAPVRGSACTAHERDVVSNGLTRLRLPDWLLRCDHRTEPSHLVTIGMTHAYRRRDPCTALQDQVQA